MSAVAADKGVYAEPRYVSQEVFDIHLQGMRDRAASEERITDTRFERLEAVMDKKLAEVRGEMSELRGEMSELRGEMNELRGEMNELKSEIRSGFALLNERIDKNLAHYEAIASDIKGDVKALGASVQSFQHRRGWDIAWTGIVIGAVIGLIQMFTTR